MNIIVFIADSLTFKNAYAIDFCEKCQVHFKNHWTNATWTLPSMASLATGKIPTTENKVYDEKPHRIQRKEAVKAKLWKNLHNKYYIVLSTPWIMISELYLHLHNIYGINILKTNSPYVNFLEFLKDEEVYYARRFSRRLGLDLRKIPQPFFHIFHNTRTHSEYGLSPNEFIKAMKEGPEALENAQKKQIELLNIELNSIYDYAPDDTLIIYTADHGEDFNAISKDQECGHAVVYTEDVLRVPLMMCYKGPKNIENKEYTHVTTHQDLYKELCYLTCGRDIDLQFNNLAQAKRDYLIFTQGAYCGEDSIKFLKDLKIGILDFKNNNRYLQSMINNTEELLHPVEYKDQDNYRNIALQCNKEEEEKKEINWYADQVGVNPPHDEF